MIAEKTYTAPFGLHILPSSDLAYKNILVVHREGIETDLVSAGETGRQVRHNLVTGFLHFDPLLPFSQEKINVIYE